MQLKQEGRSFYAPDNLLSFSLSPLALPHLAIRTSSYRLTLDDTLT